MRLSCLWAGLLLAAPSFVSAQSVLISRDRPGYHINPVDMLDVLGVYHLSDGRVLRISRDSRRVWADLPGVGKIPLTPVSSIAFVSPDQAMRFQFQPMAFATDVVITMLPRQRATLERQG